MKPALAKRLFAGESVVRFGMFGPDGRPCLVPVLATVLDDGAEGVVAFAVDAKSGPTPTTVPFLTGMSRSPRVTLLADRCLLDGAPLWWVQADAVAELVVSGSHDDDRFDLALRALERQYPHYGMYPAPSLVVWNTVISWSGYQIETA